MVIDVTIYLYESPCISCNVAVTRRIDGIEIIGLYTNEYRGGLDTWVTRFSNSEAEEILDRSLEEVGGLLDCSNCDRYDVSVTESEYRPPITVIPTSACNLYRELGEEIERENRNKERVQDEIADVLAREPPEGLTPDQRREIRRLNDEIRDSDTIIRENEREKQELEKQFSRIKEECS